VVDLARRDRRRRPSTRSRPAGARRRLEELGAIDAEKARMVELRYYVGLSLEETARVMDVSVAT
jgi:DNA-directed RNA polymerase specialized sigma24 family protein